MKKKIVMLIALLTLSLPVLAGPMGPVGEMGCAPRRCSAHMNHRHAPYRNVMINYGSPYYGYEYDYDYVYPPYRGCCAYAYPVRAYRPAGVSINLRIPTMF